MVEKTRAIVKDAISYGSSERRARAPEGEYDIERRFDRVGFYGSDGRPAFTLSLDAFFRHLTEGRIALAA